MTCDAKIGDIPCTLEKGHTGPHGGSIQRDSYPPRLATCNCNCTCICDNPAEGSGYLPTMCMVCGLMSSLNSSKHGLPFTPPKEIKLDPLEPISDAQKDKAIQEFVAENGF